MTYSRPSIRTLDALAITPGRINAPDSVSENSQIRSNVSRSGAYLDNRSPENLLRSGEARARDANNRARDMQGFMESLLGVGEQLYKGWETAEVGRQVNDFLSNPDNLNALAEGDRSLLRGKLRGAREQIEDVVAQRASNGRAELYSQLVAASPVMSGDALVGKSEEERSKLLAAERVRIMNRVDDAFPLAGLSARAITKFAPSEIAVQGRVDAVAYGNRNRSETNALGGSVSAMFRNIGIESASRVNVYAATGDLTTYEAVSGLVDEAGVKEGLAQISRTRDSFRYNDTEIAKFIWNGYQQLTDEINQGFGLSNNPEYLYKLQAANNTFIQMAIESGLIDLPIDDRGTSLRMLLQNDAIKLQPRIEAAQARSLVTQLGEYWINEDYNVPDAVFRGLLQIDPEKALTLLQRNRDLDRQPTIEEENLFSSLQGNILQIPDTQFNAQDLFAQINSAAITPAQKAQLSALIRQRADGVKLAPDVGQVLRSLEPAIEGVATTLLEQRDGAKGPDGFIDPKLITAESASIAGQLTTSMLNWKLAQDKAGVTPTLEQIRQEASNQLQQILKARAAQTGSAAPLDPVRRARNEIEVYLDWQKKDPGNLDAIPQRVKEKLKKEKIPLTFENARKQWLEELSEMSGPDGKRPFENIREEMQRREQEVRLQRDGTKDGNFGLPTNPGQELRRNFGLGMGGPDLPEQVASMGPNGLKALISATGSLLGGAPAQAATLDAQPTSQPKPESSSSLGPPETAAIASIQVIADPAGERSPAIAQVGTAGVINGVKSGLQRLNELFNIRNRNRLQPTEPALPQVDPNAPASRVPLVINASNPWVRAIGIAEGNLTADGRPTKAYYGHTDPGNGARNVGIFSAQGVGGNPEVANRIWFGKLNRLAPVFDGLIRGAGVTPGTQAYNRIMFNLLDLSIQAPLAATGPGGLASRVSDIVRKGATIEVIARARADSFYNPSTGRLDAPGFGNSYSRLLQDQRSRAGAYDYKRRL